MYIQQTGSNPYSAYSNYVQNRGIFSSNQLLPLSGTDLRFSGMMAPVLQARMLHEANLFDGLGARLSALSQAFSRLVQAAGSQLASSVTQGTFAGFGVTPGSIGLNGSISLAATSATFATSAISLNRTTATPATYATLITGSVGMMTDTKATVMGGRVTISGGSDAQPNHGFNSTQTGNGSANAVTDFGSMTINGVMTTIGTISNSGLTSQNAARFIVDRLNANSNNVVTASVGGKHQDQIVLTAKTAGSSGDFTINAVNKDSNGIPTDNGSTGFRAGTTGTSSPAPSTDLGSATIGGVTVVFGSLSNRSYDAQSAAQYMVNQINGTKGIAVTASVTGANKDQIQLTAKTAGSAGDFSVTSTNNSNKSLRDDGNNGFSSATYAPGKDATSGVTDFGSVTINGVTTTLGLLNNSGQTTQTATQYLVDKLNANTSNTVTASVTGANKDQILLTAKTPGSAGAFTINAATNNSDSTTTNDGFNGFRAGLVSTSGTQTFATLTQGGGGSTNTTSSGTRSTTVTNPTIGPNVVTNLQAFAQAVNGYLSELAAPTNPSRALSHRFSAELQAEIDRPESGLAGLGIAIRDGQVQIDESTFAKALAQDPSKVASTLSQAQQAISTTLSTQQITFDSLRSAALSTSQHAADISKISVTLFRIDQQSQNLSSLLDTLRKTDSSLNQQQQQWQKQQDSLNARQTREADNKQRKHSPAMAVNPTDGSQGPALPTYGLVKSPVADYLNGTSLFGT